VTDNDEIRLLPLRHLPEVKPNDDLAQLIVRAAHKSELRLQRGDILVVAQKIVSKAEGRLVNLAAVKPSQFAQEIAARQGRDARLIEVVLGESARIVRMDEHVLIAETRHGFVCANAGVDKSNVKGKDWVALLPVAPDDSALLLRARLAELLKLEIAVVITDTFGRAWREGLTNVAIGVAGIAPLKDLRGELDDHGKQLSATVLAVADEVAAAAGLLMSKNARTPVVLVRGLAYERGAGAARQLVRSKERDLFR
jgi:coenzyme F420-0:L-glutamate ligase/coenzyme F420-1:gamma-L-glutamate ligase